MGSNMFAWRVRFIAFASGAAVMGVELMASRLFAPAFGDSVFVWGSLIGVIMLALAAGYWLGGRRADKNSSYNELSNIVLASGALVLAIPWAAPYVLEYIRRTGLGDVYGPLLASILLLTGPTALLGMVSPYAVRLSAGDMVSLGSVSGGLSSINTAGSIFGTFFTVFVLIPFFGTREIITSLGVLLMFVSLIGRDWKEKMLLILLVGLLLLPEALVGGRLRVLGGTMVYRKETPYSTLTVVDNTGAGIRYMFLNDMAHSLMYLNGSTRAASRYTDYFNLAFGFNPSIRDVLFIGGGGFSGPKQFLEEYPRVNVDVVEIDPYVVEAAYEYFHVPKDEPRLRVYTMDGRAFLDQAGSYDLVVLDAYSHTYVPFHLMTLEFHQLLRQHLNQGGVLVSNLISSFVGDTSELLWCEVETVAQVYPHVHMFSTFNTSEAVVRNIVMVASSDPEPTTAEIFSSNIQSALKVPDRVLGYYKTLYCGEPFGRQIVLVDNYAPVDTLLNPVTLTNYDESGRLREVSLVNPYALAGLWALSIAMVYKVSSLLTNQDNLETLT
jgi:spermidine synthase